jgi:Holliday junction resolvase RusA-like endonuclease
MTAPLLIVRVLGNPITQGSKTPTKNGGMRESRAKELKPWRAAVTGAALSTISPSSAMPWQPLDGPVRVELTFTMPKPKGAPKTRRTWPIAARSGDVDKLTRAIFDSLTDAGVWGDDVQVVEVLARKVYPYEHPLALGSPGAVIHIWSAAE